MPRDAALRRANSLTGTTAQMSRRERQSFAMTPVEREIRDEYGILAALQSTVCPVCLGQPTAQFPLLAGAR